MDKILQSVGSRDGNISVTNDGATILRSIHVDNAAAKVLVDIAKTQASFSRPSCALRRFLCRDFDFCFLLWSRLLIASSPLIDGANGLLGPQQLDIVRGHSKGLRSSS